PECPFCRIASGTLPAHIVYETERLVAFLDIAPIRPGHTQIIPKEHHVSFEQTPAELLAEITLAGQEIARALKDIYRVERVGFAFLGTDVAHTHAHLVPLVSPDDLTSRRFIVEEKVTYRRPPCPPHEEMAATVERIRAALAGREPRASRSG